MSASTMAERLGRTGGRPALARALARGGRVLAFAAALAGCAGSTSSGNGVASKTPAQIVATARAAAMGAATVHVAGSILRDAQPISLDMELVSEKGGVGRVTLGGLSLELVELDGSLYVNGNSAFDEHIAGAAAARRLQGVWLKGPADSGALRSLASLTDLSQLLAGTLAGHGVLTRTADATVAGRKAVGVTDMARGGILYVAASGIPYPLEIVWRGAAAGKLVFSDWNQAAEPTAPARAISIKQLQSRR